VHLVFGTLPYVDNRASLNRLVIGIGNAYRRDDGVGLLVADEIAKRGLPEVRVVTAIGEPGAILDAWSGADLAVVVDAAMGEGLTPGRIRRWTPGDVEGSAVVSSHALGLPQTYALGEALGQIPDRLVVFTVDVADTGHGVGLSPAIAAAVPKVLDTVLAELA
jgi:hydrogenase maturation protease